MDGRKKEKAGMRRGKGKEKVERLGREMKEGEDQSKGCVIVIQTREGKDKESEAGRYIG